jgi:conjugative relaxase-like TrwC/TraI family protein
MLTVAKITRVSAQGYSEYLEGKARASELGDYYLRDGERVEAPGRWAGGASLFGIDPSRPVAGHELRAMMDVRRPDTDGPLRAAGAGGEAVAALDATFSAPKSVSAVWALAGPNLSDQIEQAHERAVDRALGYAVGQVPMLRRRVSRDTVIHEKATGVVATSWRHTTARSVDGALPDPQLHSHVLLHGAVRRGGKVMAIDSRSWLVHRREVGAAYRTELARELAGLGFGVQRGTGRGGRYFEIAGIPQELLDRWSSRHHQVQAAIQQRLDTQREMLAQAIVAGGPEGVEAAARLELLDATGLLSPREERLMVTATRSSKTPVTVTDLDTAWRRDANGIGFGRERVEVLRRQPQAELLAAGRREVLDGLTEFDAVFPARDARAVALERSAGAPIHDALERLRAMRSGDDILVLADRAGGTTREHRGRERAVVQLTQQLAERHVAPVPSKITAQQIELLDRELKSGGGRLSGEQRAAIELACGTQPLVVIEGHAGTGKSTTLTGIARAHVDAGRTIIVTSTAALAAERLAGDLTQAGVECDAYSTIRLATAVRDGRVELGPESTVIHDEAALASTREQLRLLEAVQESGARLIEVGDPGQNQPVGAAGLWNHIDTAVDDAGGRVELTVNQRAQNEHDRRDQARFRDGDAEHALRGYAARDRVHLQTDQQTAEDRALDAAQANRQAGLRTIVIAQTTNDQLDELNARAQAIRRQHHELGDKALPLPHRPYELHAGDEITVRRTLQHPEHGPLRNGTTARIHTATPNGLELQLGDGKIVALNHAQAEQADLRLAYVQHPFPAQGITTDTSHLIVAEHATREGTYVALTRARQQTHIYAAQVKGDDPIVALTERVNRTEPDVPSINTPLAHENAITVTPDVERADPSPAPLTIKVGNEPNGTEELAVDADREAIEREETNVPSMAGDRPGSRRWPGRPNTPEEIDEHTTTRARDRGWEV